MSRDNDEEFETEWEYQNPNFITSICCSQARQHVGRSASSDSSRLFRWSQVRRRRLDYVGLVNNTSATLCVVQQIGSSSDFY